MGIRIMMGGGGHERHREHEPDMMVHYPMDNYAHDLDHELRRRRAMLDDMEHDMRRRRAMLDDMEEMEMRRRSRSAMDKHYPYHPADMVEELRRRRAAMDNAYPLPYGGGDEMNMPPHDARRIGFYPEGRGEHGSEHGGMVQGMAKSLPLEPRLDAVLEDAVKVLKNTPETWKPYLKTHDYAGIVRMEGKELLQALEQGKSMKDVRKELMHTLAALFQSIIK